MKYILMVCLGNICRSPLAEGILSSKVNENIKVDSAGTLNYHIGKKPDIRSIAIASKYGIDISQQKCRQFHFNDFDTFDIIYTMDKSNYQHVLTLARNDQDKSKVKMIMNEQFENENIEVPDPYYGEDMGFEDVFRMLDKVCNIIVEKYNLS